MILRVTHSRLDLYAIKYWVFFEEDGLVKKGNKNLAKISKIHTTHQMIYIFTPTFFQKSSRLKVVFLA